MRVIKDCIAHILYSHTVLPVLPVLADVINCSLTSSVYMYPDAWKYKEVIPLPKEFDHEIATKSCPLCLLPTVSKVCKKAAFAQLILLIIFLNTSF